MLKITVSLVPGGIGPEKKLGELRIANVAGGELAEYQFALVADDLPLPIAGKIEQYPRWSASVWDLVIRALAKGLYSQEHLGMRPVPVRERVPIHEPDGLRYVCMAEIPEPAHTPFKRRMRHSTVPVIPGAGDCAYAHDWQDFLNGYR